MASADSETDQTASRNFGALGGIAVLAVFAAALFTAYHYYAEASGDVPDDPNNPITLRQ